jgi:hypothetical protein
MGGGGGGRLIAGPIYTGQNNRENRAHMTMSRAGFKPTATRRLGPAGK